MRVDTVSHASRVSHATTLKPWLLRVLFLGMMKMRRTRTVKVKHQRKKRKKKQQQNQQKQQQKQPQKQKQQKHQQKHQQKQQQQLRRRTKRKQP